MRAQASFHANDTRWQLLERVFETESSDLLTKGDLPVDTQSDDVKNLLADIDTDDRERRGTKVLPCEKSATLVGVTWRDHLNLTCRRTSAPSTIAESASPRPG